MVKDHVTNLKIEDNEDLAAPLEQVTTALLASEIQVLLAEKRTALAVLRTGIAIALVPLSITTVLVTLSRFYSWLDNLHFLVPMYGVLTGLIILSGYLIVRAMRKIRHYDELIAKLRAQSPVFRALK
jgi:uncharacterized membrane protein YidH (DUF202 family)